MDEANGEAHTDEDTKEDRTERKAENEMVEEKVEVAQEDEKAQDQSSAKEEPKTEEVVAGQDEEDKVTEGKEAAAIDNSQDSVTSPLNSPSKESSPASPKPQIAVAAAEPDA